MMIDYGGPRHSRSRRYGVRDVTILALHALEAISLITAVQDSCFTFVRSVPSALSSFSTK